MRFIVSSTYLLKHLQTLGGIINNSNTMPILENFLFQIQQNQLKLSASDQETMMSAVLDIDSGAEGVIAIPAKMLLETLKTFPEQPLTFIIEDNHTLTISSDQGKYTLAYVDGAEFPKAVAIADPSTTTLPGDVLASAINKTLFAAGNDELRPMMNGVFFQLSPEHSTFVATDAHKLVKYRRQDVTASQVAEFIMPKKPLTLLKNILADSESNVTIQYNEHNAKFIFDTSELICRLVDGKYPNYDAVIPKENPNVLTVSRNQLLRSVRRVALFSSKTTHQIRLKVAGTELHISAEDVDYSNKAEERLSCSYQGDDMQIGFNARFLTEMLNNLSSDEVSLEMSLPNRAGILIPMDGKEKGEQLTMLVMPVMLNS